jgi:hypothetical protein
LPQVALPFTICSVTRPTLTPSPFYWFGLFSSQTFPCTDIPQLSDLVILHLPAYEDGTDSVPKRWHIKFICRGITQKKMYNKTLIVQWPCIVNCFYFCFLSQRCRL